MQLCLSHDFFVLNTKYETRTYALQEISLIYKVAFRETKTVSS